MSVLKTAKNIRMFKIMVKLYCYVCEMEVLFLQDNVIMLIDVQVRKRLSNQYSV